MKRVLFVSNGHGEEAIAARLAIDLQSQCDAQNDHLALVGESNHSSTMRQVGPRRSMPSGGLIAMGNVRNILRDFRSGLLVHTLAQLRFLRKSRGRYDAAVAVGDIFALLMAKQARAKRTIFVGTAKSVYVAPYGPLEERFLRHTDAVFVRDPQTAQRLSEHGVCALAPGNVIVDLFSETDPSVPSFDERLALFPGSREAAYSDAVFLCAVIRDLSKGRPHLGATLSIAPRLSAQRFIDKLREDGWDVCLSDVSHCPFVLQTAGRRIVDAWTGPPGAMLAGAKLVLGQAGTANEAAAASGIPVLAFEEPGAREHGWYRMRQRGLLGAAMKLIAGNPPVAATQVGNLLDDDATRAAMGRIGRERMGGAGGSAAIAAKIADVMQC
ncbi:MAG: hypothetical protein ABR584_06650 [Candidatus Baltobacteraceae bacterium]